MKFRYAIVLALVALVAVAGFASADRLPQQVPENQIFTIDTLIDVTGAVSQESEMQWTINSQNQDATGEYWTNTTTPSSSAGYLVDSTEYGRMLDWATKWASSYGGVVSD
ncbi:MAG TPA: hypothetical protein PLG55_04140, partial [Methanospirillum sp.]|uniref:hypothetical protein n=1 Tax=Methanospirillum sp. TaxID=45200 RepID=UPI002BC4CCDF